MFVTSLLFPTISPFSLTFFKGSINIGFRCETLGIEGLDAQIVHFPHNPIIVLLFPKLGLSRVL